MCLCVRGTATKTANLARPDSNHGVSYLQQEVLVGNVGLKLPASKRFSKGQRSEATPVSMSTNLQNHSSLESILTGDALITRKDPESGIDQKTHSVTVSWELLKPHGRASPPGFNSFPRVRQEPSLALKAPSCNICTSVFSSL